MIFSIASGKGGTGKTTIATSLAVVARGGAAYVDCDVEEPNGHLFLRPEVQSSVTVERPVPRVDPDRCTLCGDCRDACRFGALAVLPKSVLVFDELCHGCGGCRLACREYAIREEMRPIGVVENGAAGPVRFRRGLLNVGEAMSPPLIRAVRAGLPDAKSVILDAPPGTSCPVVAAVNRTDACLLVTEPTPFGLHDLKLAVEMARALGVPAGVAINRDGIGDDHVERYCASAGVPILARIPDDRAVAEGYSRGIPAVEAVPSLAPVFTGLWDALFSLARSAKDPAA